MQISQKTHYALLALFELANAKEAAPLSIPSIAEAQEIPVQFLQTILRQLRQGGFVESFRGKEGGYRLARDSRQLTMGDVIRFFEGPVVPLDSVDEAGNPTTPSGECDPFRKAWSDATRAVNRVYDRYTLQDIVEQWGRSGQGAAPDYAI